MMDFPRDSEIVYGGDMCNRRLRGIKVNPIYQEKEVPGSSDDNGSIPVGEIQIDMYESLPRKRRILQYSPDAVLLAPSAEDSGTTSTNLTHIRNESFFKKCNKCNNTLERSCSCKENVRSQKNRVRDLNDNLSSGSEGTGLKNDNTGQIRTIISSNINGESTANLTSTNNNNDSLDSGSYSNDLIRNARENNYVVIEDRVGNKECNGDNNINNIPHSNTLNEDRIAGDFESIPDKAILLNKPNCISSDAIVAYAITDHPNPKNIYSFNSFSNDLSDVELTLKENSNKLYSLEHISQLPSYSNLHNSLPVCPIDFINNNHETMPDQMVMLHNSIQSDDGSSNKAFQLLSNTNSANQSPYSKGDKKQNGVVSGCDCHGKPTLKCVCGRRALQKLLKQKHLIKSDSHDGSLHLHQTIQEDGTVCFEETPPEEESMEKETSQLQKQDKILHQDSIIEEVESEDITEHNSFTMIEEDKQINTSKSILLSGNRRGSRIQECRTIKFAKGTVFNESKTTKYVKERRRPAQSDDIKLENFSNGEMGIDNPVFIGDEDIPDSVFYDETSFQQGIDLDYSIIEGSSSLNTLTRLQDGSLILKAEDLNIPAYMDSYIRSLSNICEVTKNKAPPVSIEALGSMTIADYSDEIAVDVEYNRRRRKNKHCNGDEGDAWLRKKRRIKTIKICVVVFVIFAAICTGIGLGIHYGGDTTDTPDGGNPILDQKSTDVGRFGLAIFK